ncbi:MAG: hypothetical protein RLZZ143_2546 [Cyanobacteriota bacterium]|jgi:hypothetical protein
MITTTDNNSNQPLVSLREIQELSIAITAKSLNPAMLTVDFLKYSGIVPPDWELNGQPVLNPNYAQVNFQNGISIVAQPRTITFVEIIKSPDSLNLKLPEIVGLYLDKLPLAEYQALSIAPKSIVPFPSGPDAAKKYITETLLAPGPWHNFGKAPLQAGINLLYQLETSQLSVAINEAKLQLPDGKTLGALLFAGNFNYNLAEGSDRFNLLKQYLRQWQKDLEIFRELITQRFLERQV